MYTIELKEKKINVNGRIFVVSDIHACINTFKKLLNKIKFSKEDFLIINGDLIDRGGANNIEIIKFISEFKNIILLRGNHEEFYFRTQLNELSEYQWHHFGGKNTLMELKKCNTDDYLLFHNYIIKSSLFAIVTMDDKEYFISHNGFNIDMNIVKDNNIILNEDTLLYQYNENWFDFFVSSDINMIPYTTKFKYHWIVGHYPTIRILEEAKILKKQNYTNIDCGCTYNGGKLGILCLNDFSEYYEDILKKDLD